MSATQLHVVPGLTHYIPAFTTRDRWQRAEAACGHFIDAGRSHTEPTCAACKAFLLADADGELTVAGTPQPRLSIDPASHALQAIHAAGGDLLDLALRGDRDLCVRLQSSLHGVLERLFEADEVMTRCINREE